MTSDSLRNRLLAVIALVAVGAALRLTQPVTLPLAAAVFLIALAWPVQRRLERGMPRGPAYAITILTVLAALTAFLAMIVWSLAVFGERLPEIVLSVSTMSRDVAAWLGAQGIAVDGENGPSEETILPVIASAWRAGAMLLLTVAFFVLGLTEVHHFRDRLVAYYGERAGVTLERIEEASRRIRGFVVAITLAGLLGGVLSLAYGALLGLEYMLLWAFLAYLLNYIPVVGSTIAVVPPTLWALIQFGGIARPLAVLIGFGAIQFVVGNYVAPRFEGRYTTISPLIVLVAILVWWLIWGPVGALLGVPLTVGLVTALRHFDGTRGMGALLSNAETRR